MVAIFSKPIDIDSLTKGLRLEDPNPLSGDSIEELVANALQRTTPNDSDWCYVAGRLLLHEYISRIKESGHDYSNFVGMVRSRVMAGAYSDVLSSYSDDELATAQAWIVPERDYDYDYAGAMLLMRRYLLPEVADCTIPAELPQEAMLVCALIIAYPETQHRLDFAHEIYEAVSRRKISLATPILANLRSPNGSVSSCFITAAADTLRSIVTNEVHNASRISQEGGGVGINLSRVRARGSMVRGRHNVAKGITSWAKIYDSLSSSFLPAVTGASEKLNQLWSLLAELGISDQGAPASIRILNQTALAVDQGGKRAGAITVSLDMWHLDIPEFLEIKSESGDLRRKAFDIFPQVVIPDLFMQRVIEGGDWWLFDPFEVRRQTQFELAELWGEEFQSAYLSLEQLAEEQKLMLTKKLPARELIRRIMKSQIETGLPYMFFKDTVNRLNPNSHDGYIPCGNLCQESYSNVNPGKLAHCCNLVSLNLANVEQHELSKYCGIAVRLLDNTIEITNPPIPEAKAHNDRYRTIGVGMMGLADWLAKNHLSYQSLGEIEALCEDFAYACTEASVYLARERGAYPAYEGSAWSRGEFMGGRDAQWIKENSYNSSRWDVLREAMAVWGIRNSHLSAIAPNTSSGLLQGCTPSVLPTYSRFFYDNWSKGTVPQFPPFIKDCFWFYQENKRLNQQVVIDATASIQKWIDTGISMELLFSHAPGIYGDENHTLEAVDILKCLVHAWRSGIKAIYYVRFDQKDVENSNCSSCTN